MMHRLLSFTAALAVALLCSSANAQFPSKPIRLLVPFPAGGAVDSASRVLAQAMSQALGQQVVVDNRPGADGAIAGGLLTKSAPDGYTLFFASNTAMNAVPAMRKLPPYDPIADFTPVSMIGRIGIYLFVNRDLPVRTLAELVEHARANPGKLNYGTGHATSILATAQLMSLSKTSMMQVPYKGDGPVMTDLLGGRLHLSIASPVPGVSLAREGKVRALATLLPKRSPNLPDVPTMAEAGFPEYSLVAWGGLFGPAGMPRDVVERLSREVNSVLKRPEVIEALARQNFEPEGSTPEEFAAFMKVQVDTWARAVREAGIQPD